MANWETVVVNTDLLICGGGFSACGAATEAAYWAKKKGLKVTLVDKAAVDRSGAVAMGLSAINQYVGLRDGENTLADHEAEVFRGLGVDRGRIGIRSSGQVDFRLGDVQEAPGFAGRACARFVARQHVVGGRDDFRYAARGGAQAGKGSDQGHGQN